MENKNSKLLELYQHQQTLNDHDFLYSIILYHAAPVLESDKPAVLLTFATNHRNLKALWDQYRIDYPLGSKLMFYEIKRTDSHVCVLFYHPEKLEAVLRAPKTFEFLKTMGYETHASFKEILSTLRRHSAKNCPHEVGIFLGYPLDDVLGFIENGGQNCLHCGYWKVYTDPQMKLERFQNYDKTRFEMIEMLFDKVKSPKDVLFLS